MQTLYWWVQWLLHVVSVLVPYALWLLYEAWCVKNVCHAWNKEPNDLAVRVKQRCSDAHFRICVVLGMWHVICPFLLTSSMAPENFWESMFFWKCMFVACLSWAFHSIVMWRNAGVFSMQLERLHDEMCFYNKFLSSRHATKEKEDMLWRCVWTPNACKALRTVPLQLFKKYEEIVGLVKKMQEKIDRLQIRGRTITRSPDANPDSNARGSDLLQLIEDHNNMEYIQTTLYTFAFLRVTAVPMRLVCVLCWYGGVRAVSAVYKWWDKGQQSDMHARAVAYVAKMQRERAGL